MIGFIGGGNMAEALVKGMISQGMKDIFVSEPRADRKGYLQQVYDVKTTESNKEVVYLCNIIILAIKPQDMSTVLSEIADVITDEKTVVSIAAGITLSYLHSRLKTKRVVRVMPNAPAIVQKGISVISLSEGLLEEDVLTLREIFISVGKVLVMPERDMDVITAISGSGPAFIALFIESMINNGVRFGLDKDAATELAVQTLVGTAKLINTGMPPERLIEMVASPGGTTAAGLNIFNERDLTNIVREALQAAKNRAEELGVEY
ncbi:pyrroline-5-carboxylate reductase [Thermodesulfovibrionales bacterium]|nr:pyrroline-5-carboxylate reductase [Thermodesulfovibrionales bacterium]